MENNETNQETGVYSSGRIPESVIGENISADESGNAECVNAFSNIDSAANNELVKKAVKKAKRRGRLQGFFISFAVMLVLVIAFIFSLYKIYRFEARLFLPGIKYATGSSDIITKENAAKLNKLYSYIDTQFLFDYSKEEVENGMYKGMFEALGDEYSVYYTKDEYDEMMTSYGNETFCGIGAYLQYNEENGATVVVRPMLGSPAEKAGLKKDDIIKAVDGEDVTGMDLDIVVSKVRGPAGESVHLTIVRGGKEIEVDIVRAEITEETVTGEVLDGDIGYIVITTFADQTDEQFIKNVDILLEKGIKSLIIDLRSNGGGYVDSATNIADRILGEGKILTMVDRNGNSEVINSDEENKLEIPMVVMIDGYSASASEILTGALRDYGVATTVGTTSFGKGIVQDVIPLPDGTGLKITASEYLTPSGDHIHKKGITPDVEVLFDAETYINDGIDNQLEKAKEVVKSK